MKSHSIQIDEQIKVATNDKNNLISKRLALKDASAELNTLRTVLLNNQNKLQEHDLNLIAVKKNIAERTEISKKLSELLTEKIKNNQRKLESFPSDYSSMENDDDVTTKSSEQISLETRLQEKSNEISNLMRNKTMDDCKRQINSVISPAHLSC